MKYEYRVVDFGYLTPRELERDLNAYASQGYRLVTLLDDSDENKTYWDWTAVFERSAADYEEVSVKDTGKKDA
jgi:hypothetical protein